MDNAALQKSRMDDLVVDYMFVCAAAILAYDYLLTIGDEVALVWTTKWNYTKILYLNARYLSWLSMVIMVYQRLIIDASPAFCHWSHIMASCVSLVTILHGQGILMVRTWALWNLNRKVGSVLFMFWCTVSILCVCWLILFTRSLIILDAPYKNFRGCVLYSNYLPLEPYFIHYPLFLMDAVTLAFVVASAIRAYRTGDPAGLSRIIHRDGILFYVYLLCMTIASGTTMHAAPLSFKLLLLPMPAVFYTLFSTRVILNIKQEARNEWDGDVDLHSTESARFQPNISLEIPGSEQYSLRDVPARL